MRKTAAIGLFICCHLLLPAQPGYLNRSDLLALVDSCLRHTYNFSFDKARKFQQVLETRTPDHPAPHFLYGLILYWENFPLTPEKKASEMFIERIDQSVDLAQYMLEDDQTHLEGVFFDLFGRAFKAMFWADNGRSGKVVPDLNTMYRHTKEGFRLKEQFVEFYFSTGLYNYYIEAYPEAHPVYKPLVSFMEKGDRNLGLIQLNQAINRTVFLRVESLMFMSIIQLKYENDMKTAALYAERLFREYPANIYYQGHLVSIWLHLHRFDQVRTLLERTVDQNDPFSEMIRQLAFGFFAEQEQGNEVEAGRRYQNTVELAESIGPFADSFGAMGYMGLSRLNEQKGLNSESKRYARKASNLTVYPFILNEKGSGPRL